MHKEKFMLEINNIKKYYGSFLALNNINLKLKTSELVVLLGPNGAGKSTLFSIITGLARADSGDCFINGNNVISQNISALKSLGGERTKVELIRSLLHNPKMLLMDEPTVGLDPSSRADLLKKIIYLKNSKSLSILWTTHLVDEAEKADKIIILNKGKVRATGSVKKILSLANENNLAQAFLKLVKEV